jgi:threonine aldolase
MKLARSFASDNNASVHPEVMQAITAANEGHTVAYGDDPYTQAALGAIEKTLARALRPSWSSMGQPPMSWV